MPDRATVASCRDAKRQESAAGRPGPEPARNGGPHRAVEWSDGRSHPIRAEPDRVPPCRRGTHRALLLAPCAPPRRAVHPAHRGHRSRALHARKRSPAFSREWPGSGLTGTRAPGSRANARNGTARPSSPSSRRARRIAAIAPGSGSTAFGPSSSRGARSRATTGIAGTGRGPEHSPPPSGSGPPAKARRSSTISCADGWPFATTSSTTS